MNKAHLEVFVGVVGRYRWRLAHDNGNILAGSGEGYASKQKAKQGIESVERDAPDMNVIEAQFHDPSPRSA